MTQLNLILQPLRQGLPASGPCDLHVLVRVQAPERPADLNRKHTPLHLAVVLDRSGSMSGQPLQEACRCASAIAERLVAGDQVAVIAYDNRVAHLVEAGSDFFLMPSRFEPCGLSQIYAMAYGTLPLVHAVGGLENTVVDLDEDPAHATGFKFREFTREAFLARAARAMELARDPAAHARVIRRAMTVDFSWDASARAYAELYGRVVR